MRPFLPEKNLLLQEHILQKKEFAPGEEQSISGSNLFSLRVETIEKRCKNENDRIAFGESVRFDLNYHNKFPRVS